MRSCINCMFVSNQHLPAHAFGLCDSKLVGSISHSRSPINKHYLFSICILTNRKYGSNKCCPTNRNYGEKMTSNQDYYYSLLHASQRHSVICHACPATGPISLTPSHMPVGDSSPSRWQIILHNNSICK